VAGLNLMKEDNIDNLIVGFFALAVKDILEPTTHLKHKISATLVVETFEGELNSLGLSNSFTQSVIKKGRAYYASNCTANKGTKETHNVNRILS